MSQINFENAREAFFFATPSGSLVGRFMEATGDYRQSMNFFKLEPKFALSKQLDIDTSREAITATIQRGVITAFVLPALSSISALYNGAVGVGKLAIAIVSHIKGTEENEVKGDLNLAFEHMVTAVADFAVAFFGIVVAVANFVTPDGVQLAYQKVYVGTQGKSPANDGYFEDNDYGDVSAPQSQQPSLIKQAADFLTNQILPQKQ